MIFENMDRIIFAGDSVTDMGSAQPVGEGLFDNMGHGYPRVIESLVTATYPELSIRFTNSGISGNTSKDLLARYERDVLSLNPQWVSICIGINDVWRQFDSPALTDQAVDTLAHLRRCLVGKGDRQNAPRCDVMSQKIGNLARQYLCLARTGTCHDQQWSVRMLYGLFLRGIQPLEYIQNNLLIFSTKR